MSYTFIYDEIVVEEPTLREAKRSVVAKVGGFIYGGFNGLFGIVSLLLGLSILAALPIAQFAAYGYFLESSARVGRTGRLRDGVIGIRKAARVGGLVAGSCVCFGPAWLFGSLARSAAIIDPGGEVARGWWVARGVVVGLTIMHVVTAAMRGGQLRHYAWPPGGLVWLFKSVRRGGLYVQSRDGCLDFLASLNLPKSFRVGLIGYLGTLLMLAVPTTLIAAGGKYPLVGFLGALLLTIVASWLPFLQVGYAKEDRIAMLFRYKDVRERYKRAPWAFASALMFLLLASIPLYLLKIEVIPNDAVWLPSLVFVTFLAPARILVGWAYARSERREDPRHWIGRVLGRIAIVPTALLYVLVVFLAQYTSWTGVASLFEQHAFLLPVPFLNR